MSQSKSNRTARQFSSPQASSSGSASSSPLRRSLYTDYTGKMMSPPHPFQQTGQRVGDEDVAAHALGRDIQAIIHYLRNESPLLDLVAIDLYQHLIERYGAELDQEITSDTILTTLKDWAREQCDRHNHWAKSAEGISARLVAKAIQSMERDLGNTVLESLDWNEFNQILFQYLLEHPAAPIKQRLEPLEQHYAQMLSQQIISELDLDHQPISSLKRNLGLGSHKSYALPLLGQTISHVGPIPEIASEMPLMVGEGGNGDLRFSDQFQADLWASDAREVAYLRYHAKQRRHQYLEHYLTTDADINGLPWDAIAQILTKFGLTATKLHLLLLAYSSQQSNWPQPFTITVEQLVTDIGWSSFPIQSVETPPSRQSLPRSPSLEQSNPPNRIPQTPNRIPQTKVTNVLYALSCILVKLVWVEHGGDRSVIGQTPVGKLWDIMVTPSGEFDWQTGQIESAHEISVTIRPGLWIEGLRRSSPHNSVNSAHDIASQIAYETPLPDHPYYSSVQQRLWQCGKLAYQLLQLGAYTQDLTIRMIVHLMLDIQIRNSDAAVQYYPVQTLLEQVTPPATLARTKTHIKQGQQLFEAWHDALTVLAQLRWYPEPCYANETSSGDRAPVGYASSKQESLADVDLTQLYVYPYPKWLAPNSTMRKPRGWVQTWLDQTIQIRSDIQMGSS